MDSIFDELVITIRQCQKCPLGKSRTQAVPGEGSRSADLLFVGEAPGSDEDLQGRPFVGAAGQLLTELIQTLALEREDVYIANVLKCRPPHNRNPEQAEIDACQDYLFAQIALIKPKIVVPLGNFALNVLVGKEKKVGISVLRGKLIEKNGLLFFPTYHPAAVLHNPRLKGDLLKDFRILHDILMDKGIFS